MMVEVGLIIGRLTREDPVSSDILMPAFFSPKINTSPTAPRSDVPAVRGHVLRGRRRTWQTYSSKYMTARRAGVLGDRQAPDLAMVLLGW